VQPASKPCQGQQHDVHGHDAAAAASVAVKVVTPAAEGCVRGLLHSVAFAQGMRAGAAQLRSPRRLLILLAQAAMAAAPLELDLGDIEGVDAPPPPPPPSPPTFVAEGRTIGGRLRTAVEDLIPTVLPCC
jgi:hypothetical protein